MTTRVRRRRRRVRDFLFFTYEFLEVLHLYLESKSVGETHEPLVIVKFPAHRGTGGAGGAGANEDMITCSKS